MSGCFEPAFIAASLNRPGDLAQDVAAYSDVNFRRALGLPLEVGLRNPARSGLIGTCGGMRYRLKTQQDSGEAVVLIGTKHQHRNPLRLWSDLTTLHVEAADTVGVLRISPPGVLKLASSIR